MKSSPKFSVNFLPKLAILSVIASSFSAAFAATQIPTTAADFFSAPIQTTPPTQHKPEVLNQIFTTGVGPFDPATMSGKIFPYNLPRNSVFNAPAYNGCYDKKNTRLGDLDPDLSCTTIIAAHPDIPVYRLFVGYKVDCAETPDSLGNCNDTSLLFNCEYTQVHAGNASFDPTSATYYCSRGSPIIRRAKANTDITPAIIGCYPGEDGTSYPICTKCAAGYYNAVVGANTQACTQCSLSDIPADSMLFAKTTPQNFTTSTATGPTGATSASQCKISATDSWECMSGYQKTSDNQTCVEIPPCNLKLNTTSINPTTGGGSNDGSITATYSGQSGSVTAFLITSPSAIPPDASGKFSGLAPNTYTVKVTDSVCTTTASVSLVLETTPSPTPAPTATPTSTPTASPTSTVSPIPGCDMDPNDVWLVRASCSCASGYQKSGSTNSTGLYYCELIPPLCDVATETATDTKPMVCTYTCGTDIYQRKTRDLYLNTSEKCTSQSAIDRVGANTGCGNPVPTSCVTNKTRMKCADKNCPAGTFRVLIHDYNYGLTTYLSIPAWNVPTGQQVDYGFCINGNGLEVTYVCGMNDNPGDTGKFNPSKGSYTYPTGAQSDSFQKCTNGYFGYTGINLNKDGTAECSR